MSIEGPLSQAEGRRIIRKWRRESVPWRQACCEGRPDAVINVAASAKARELFRVYAKAPGAYHARWSYILPLAARLEVEFKAPVKVTVSLLFNPVDDGPFLAAIVEHGTLILSSNAMGQGLDVVIGPAIILEEIPTDDLHTAVVYSAIVSRAA